MTMLLQESDALARQRGEIRGESFRQTQLQARSRHLREWREMAEKQRKMGERWSA